MIPRLQGSFQNWLAAAKPGDRVIVQTQPETKNKHVSKAIEEQLVTAVQRRAGDEDFDLIAIRLKAKPRLDKPSLGAGRIGQQERCASSKGHKPATLARMRRAVELHAKGMTYAEIAPRLEVKPETVKDYIRNAREAGIA